jgi:hypothetical protein
VFEEAETHLQATTGSAANVIPFEGGEDGFVSAVLRMDNTDPAGSILPTGFLVSVLSGKICRDG